MTGDEVRLRRVEEARRAGDQARDEGRWEAASQAYRAYLAERPHDAAIWVQLGHMRSEAGDYPGANRAYHTAWRLVPEDPDLLLCWGHSRRRAGDLAAARDLYARSYRLEPGADARAGLEAVGGRIQDAEPVQSFRILGHIDRVMGREVTGHVRAPVRHDAYVEFRRAGEIVGRVELDGVLRDGRYTFEATLALDEDATIDAYVMPDDDGFSGSPFRVSLSPPDPPAVAAWQARAEVRRPRRLSEALVAVLACSSRTGGLRANVEPYVHALKAQGVPVVLVVSAQLPVHVPGHLADIVDGLVVREGAGRALDLAGWAHALGAFPELYSCSRLLLLSDAMAGPAEGEAFTGLIDRVRSSGADFIALTQTYDGGWRPERYFMAFGGELLSSPALQHLFETFPIRIDDEEVERERHRALAEAVARGDGGVEVLFRGAHPLAPLTESWRRLARAGLPFAAARPPEGEADVVADWREALHAAGFDLDVMADMQAEEAAPTTASSDERLMFPPLPAEPVRDRPLRLALVCDWSSTAPQGEAWRRLTAALREAGCELALHPLPKGSGGAQVAPPAPQYDFRGAADVAVLQLGDDLPTRFSLGQVQAARMARLRIGAWFEPPPDGDGRLPTPRTFDLHRIWTLAGLADDVTARSDAPVDVWPLTDRPDVEAGALASLGGRIDAGLRSALQSRTTPEAPRFPRLKANLGLGLALNDPRLATTFEVLALEPDGGPPAGEARPGGSGGRFTGDGWTLLAPRGACLAPHTAASLREHARLRPEVALFYADDLAIQTEHAVDQLRLKPDFDLALLAAQDYVGAPVMVRTSVLAELGGLDPGRGTAAVADLLFRAHARGLVIARIPEVLLAHPGQRVRATDGDYRSMLAAQPALAAFQIGPGRTPSSFALSRRFDASSAPEVTLVVPTRRSLAPEGDAYVTRLLKGLAATTWPMERLHVLVGDDLPEEPDWSRASWPFALRRIETPRSPGASFNYAAKMNRLWREASTEQVVFINDDVRPLDGDWLAALQTFAVDPGVGGVGARLLFEDGALQHAGLAPHGLGAAHAWVFRRRREGTYQNWAEVHRQWSMVTGALFATRRSVLERIGGFDERFSLEFNDADLCLRLRAFGYRIVYTPHAELIHVEKASRGETPPPGGDRALFRSRWAAWLDNDPSWHPRLRKDVVEVMPELPAEGSWYL